jgi:acyl-CoA synthetase (AMP-forming)/AMP-acid ligase II
MVKLLLAAHGLPETDLSRLELILHAAAPMPAALAEQARRVLGVRLQTIYGITEGGGPAISLRPDDKPGEPPMPGATCIGLPMLGAGVQIRRDDGTPVAAGEVGEIHLAGDGLMLGYWRNDPATAEVLRDGWLNTKDFGCYDKAGYIWVVDRRTDLILRGGQNVYPAELEHVLRASPRVADVAVVPAPSEIWGQTPVAFVQPTVEGELDETELVRLCLSRLASYKRPSRFVIIDQLPRSATGKVLRPQLRERAAHLAEGALTP